MESLKMSQISQIYLCIKWHVEGKLGESRTLLEVCLNHKTPQFVSEWYSPGFSVPHNVMLFWKPDVGIGGCKTTQQLWWVNREIPIGENCHSHGHPLATPWLCKHPQATGKSFHPSCKHSWTLTSLPSPCVTLDNPGSSKNLETAATEVVVVRAEVGLKKQKCRISNKN